MLSHTLYCVYNNKLYTNRIVYDLNTDEFVNFSGENLGDNHILLIEDDIIYVSHVEQSDNNYNESIYTYDLNMNKLNEYKVHFESIDKIINYEDKMLVIGRETKNDDSIIIDASDFLSKNDILNCDESGSTLRFFIPLCLLDGKEYTLTGSKRLFERNGFIDE